MLLSHQEMCQDILEDLDIIHLAKNRDEFDDLTRLAVVMWQEWSDEDGDAMDEFIQYFLKTWVFSKQSFWFLGAGPISHNNGVEGCNCFLKRDTKFKHRQLLGTFISNALIVTRQFSKKDHHRITCDRKDLVSDEDERKG